jgi:uncharacterized MAPEG superfamily protein
MEYVPYIAITAAFALVYLPRLVVSAEMKKLEGGYNNREPRSQQAKLDGIGRRALAAHHNSFEAFAPFAIGVLAAIQRGHLTATAYISIAFIAARGLYIWAYLADKAMLRSTAWTIGIIATTALMFLAIIGR